MITKKEIIKDFKNSFNINRLTVDEIYRVAAERGYRDLRGFHTEKFSFGSWMESNTSRPVFISNDRFEAIKFLTDSI